MEMIRKAKIYFLYLNQKYLILSKERFDILMGLPEAEQRCRYQRTVATPAGRTATIGAAKRARHSLYNSFSPPFHDVGAEQIVRQRSVFQFLGS